MAMYQNSNDLTDGYLLERKHFATYSRTLVDYRKYRYPKVLSHIKLSLTHTDTSTLCGLVRDGDTVEPE